MNYYIEPIARLINEFSRLPGIGGKTAQRLAFHIIDMPKDRVMDLTQAISKAREDIHNCSICCS